MKLTNPKDWETRRSEVQYKTATELLVNPKMNLTARGRRKLAKQRQLRYHATQLPKYSLDRISEKVAKLSMGRLTRLIAKSSARVNQADRILEDLAPDSLFREGVEAQRANEQNVFVLATNEYKMRTKGPVKDCRAPNGGHNV